MSSRALPPASRSATVPIYFVREMFARLAAQQDVVERCFAATDIPPALLLQDSARVTVEQFALFYRQLAVALDDETPGFFSRPLRGGTLKFLCLALLDAPSLRVALYRFCGFFRLLIDDLQFVMEERGEGVRIAIEERVKLGGQRTLLLEVMLMLIQGIASWMIERRILFARVDLAYPAPAHAGDYPNLYAGPACFDQPLTALYFDPGVLQTPIRQDKRALSRFLSNAPADWLHVSVSERLMTHRVRDLLEAGLGDNLNLEAVAAVLHVSARTLARRLDAEGTRFQAVKNALRRDVAIDRISRTEEQIASIGASLGFDDPSVFNRAFKQWTGSPPGSYRKTRAPEG